MYDSNVLAIVMGTWVVFIILALAFYIIDGIFWMKIFAKANTPAWKAWVPFVNSWKILELGGFSGAWCLLWFMPILGYLFSLILVSTFIQGAIAIYLITGLIDLVLSLIAGIISCMAIYNIGKKLGKSGAWVLLFIFGGVIWLGICALDSSRWNDSLGRPTRGNDIPPGFRGTGASAAQQNDYGKSELSGGIAGNRQGLTATGSTHLIAGAILALAAFLSLVVFDISSGGANFNSYQYTFVRYFSYDIANVFFGIAVIFRWIGILSLPIIVFAVFRKMPQLVSISLAALVIKIIFGAIASLINLVHYGFEGYWEVVDSLDIVVAIAVFVVLMLVFFGVIKSKIAGLAAAGIWGGWALIMMIINIGFYHYFSTYTLCDLSLAAGLFVLVLSLQNTHVAVSPPSYEPLYAPENNVAPEMAPAPAGIPAFEGGMASPLFPVAENTPASPLFPAAENTPAPSIFPAPPAAPAMAPAPPAAQAAETTLLSQPPVYEANITGVSGTYAGVTIPLTGNEEIIIGIDPGLANVVMETAYREISRKHVSISYDAVRNVYCVADYSANGTWANDTKLKPGTITTVAPGTLLKLATERVRFLVG